MGPGTVGLGGGGGKEPPDLEEILSRGQDRSASDAWRRRQRRRRRSRRRRAEAFPVFDRHAAAGGRRFYGFFFRVNPDEQGIVMRFGKFVRREPPGLHFRWPYPIEEVRLPKVTRQRTSRSAVRPERVPAARDERLDADGRRQRRRRRFRRLLAHQPEGSGDGETASRSICSTSHNPETTVKEVAESAMREVVGQSNIQPILTGGARRREEAVQKLMQKTLD